MPAESLRSDPYRTLDDVDEYIRERQRRRQDAHSAGRVTRRNVARSEREGQRSGRDSAERARARELLGTDFFWSDLASRSGDTAAPDGDVLTRSWDDAIDVRETSPADLRASAAPARDRAPVEIREPRRLGPDPAADAVPAATGSLADAAVHRALEPAGEPDGVDRPAAWVQGADGERRTVVITGRGAERWATTPRRGYDAHVRPHERAGFKPDRVAMWAVLLGLALLLGAAASSHAAVLHVASQLAAHAGR
jgi:hypothetical protein